MLMQTNNAASSCVPCLPPVHAVGSHEAIEPMIDLLIELDHVVLRLSDAQYAQKPVGVVDASVGGHVRHCLDHVRSLVDSIYTGELNYDNRRRGTDVESMRHAASGTIGELLSELRVLDDRDLDRTVRLTTLLSPDRPSIRVRTTLGRELAYVLAHTIHHNALIGAMVKTLGGWLPDRFGYAPSTLRNRRDSR